VVTGRRGHALGSDLPADSIFRTGREAQLVELDGRTVEIVTESGQNRFAADDLAARHRLDARRTHGVGGEDRAFDPLTRAPPATQRRLFLVVALWFRAT
jgi:hypothetical protein